MRKLFGIFVFMIITGMLVTGTCMAADGASPRIILYTFYWVIGEGDDLQVGAVDEQGNLLTLSGIFSEMDWPYAAEDQLAYLSQTEKFSTAGKLESGELFALKSLIAAVERQEEKAVGVAEDAGTEDSYAVRYSQDGEPEVILLGESGETVFENTDPNAQALYLRLRKYFPGVISYGYDEDGMGPAGFIPVPFAEFTGLDADALDGTELRGFVSDSEEGNLPLELKDEDRDQLMALIRGGIVTGKADTLSSTGGVTSYCFYGPDDSPVGSVDFEDGLLVTGDGRYYFGMP